MTECEFQLRDSELHSSAGLKVVGYRLHQDDSVIWDEDAEGRLIDVRDRARDASQSTSFSHILVFGTILYRVSRGSLKVLVFACFRNLAGPVRRKRRARSRGHFASLRASWPKLRLA
jgi:hypothetical protein